MPYSNASPTITRPQTARPFRGKGAPREKKPAEIIKTWAFDSVGTRKYALQIKKASNGNPCLMLVEGVPQDDGTFRKFNITIWSEDFSKLFETLDQVRAFMAANNIRTPEGHSYDPSKRRTWKPRPEGRRQS